VSGKGALFTRTHGRRDPDNPRKLDELGRF
jgi:hypothetical protein